MAEKVTIVEYDVKQRAETIAENKRLNDDRYSSWKAINIGTGNVSVDGVVLAPGEGIEHVLQPCETWKEPIDIQILTTGGAVRLLRKICKPHAKTYIARP